MDPDKLNFSNYSSACDGHRHWSIGLKPVSDWRKLRAAPSASIQISEEKFAPSKSPGKGLMD